jgi:23S rRNA pseudouridine2457 synthase
MQHRYFLVHKPYGMVSQFVSPDAVGLLGDLDFDFPEDTHAVGRLDRHSEGLLLLTTNKKVTRLLFESPIPHRRIYLVQVKNVVTASTLQQLQTGITLRGKGGEVYTTAPCEVKIVARPRNLSKSDWEIPAAHPHTWLLLVLTQGRYHQVRKMVAAVGHRCRRLIRVAIEELTLGDLLPGEVREVAETDFFEQLRIER